ncbi:hypothetical protein B0181_11260 [Moraxella caviae]|uniref:Uncharacterized protein n=1 Tax=Moraxella caviae TaxID=34060 RepID=A0A1S9ZUC4_9GAMM|nr:hypothetical protein [Moraxella caviae]OOR87058.1 hypothetical protein B0181_11260 [Moraxella caviae]STZ13561.1 Uncharacterised protein [Moraxella caviae]
MNEFKYVSADKSMPLEDFIHTVRFDFPCWMEGYVDTITVEKTSSDGSVETVEIPRLLGYDYKTGKKPTELDFKETPLYVTKERVWDIIFRREIDPLITKEEDLASVLTSMRGLVGGYEAPEFGCRRDAAIVIEDVIETTGVAEFKFPEGADVDAMDNATMLSYLKYHDPKARLRGSLKMDLLQYICLDPNSPDCAVKIRDDAHGEQLAKELRDYLKSFWPERFPRVTYHKNIVRKDSGETKGGPGLLLNDIAVDVLAELAIITVSEVYFHTGNQYTRKFFKVNRGAGDITYNNSRGFDFKRFYEAVDLPES